MQVIEQISPSLKATMAAKGIGQNLPEHIGFGELMVPIMVRVSYRAGQWQPIELLPYQPISMSPDCKGLHYGQVIFEGLKAYYNVQTAGAGVFCPQLHWARLNQSAARLAMPSMSYELFETALMALLSRVGGYLPTTIGDALYIRPFMYASQTGLGLNSDEFEFYIIASPSAAYFNGTLKVLIERQLKRACQGGSGMAKMAGNYGSTFLASKRAAEQGCGLSLWLDAQQGRYVEEFSAMNFFAVRNGELHTPKLGGTILAGVTRMAVMALAEQRGIKVVETDIAIDDLLADIATGACSEVFASGTGATLTGVSHLLEHTGESVAIGTGDHANSLCGELKHQLQQIHHGQARPPQDDWLKVVIFKDNEP